MKSLRRLVLRNNQLTGDIPPELGGLTGLDEFLLRGNDGLTGCVPPPLKNVAKHDLGQLGPGKTGLPDCACWNGTVVANPSANPGLVADCAALLEAKAVLIGAGTGTLNWSDGLAIASWEGVGLTSSVPKRVRQVNLSGKSLAGEIPAQLGDLTRLEVVHLSGNRLSGNIPDLSGATGLQVLKAINNQLEGEIPPWLGGMKSLRRLVLRNNQLTGDIPPELGGLTGLDEFLLDGNDGLTGCVPPPLKNVKNNDISQLGLPDCACWNGTVVASPASNLGLVADCATLLEAKAALIGTGTGTLNWSEGLAIASWEGVGLTTDAPSRVKSLSLSGQSLAGSIPAQLGRLDGLTILNLARNSLTGNIPPDLGDLTNLDTLNLSGNSLTGNIPSDLEDLTNLDTLNLGGNTGLTGCIPTSLRNVEDNDLGRLGLPNCAAPASAATPTAPSG